MTQRTQQFYASVLYASVIIAIGLPATLLAVDLPENEEEKEKLSGRQIRILRRQMSSREEEAEAAFKNAETAFLVGQYDKATEEFLAVGREYKDTSYRMKAVLRVGDVYYRQQEYERAISYYQRALRIPSEPWWPPESKDDYARASYMIGVCYFDQKAYNPMFAHFRRFVKEYPESKLVDQAYNFIGRANMEMERYGQAVEAFKMVGTTNIQKQTGESISPGEQLYVQLRDEDVGIAQKEDRISVRLSTSSGDEEMVYLRSLGLGSAVFLGTIKTRLGQPRRTRTLDEAYSASIQQQIDDWLVSAQEMSEQADEAEERAKTLEKKVERAQQKVEEQEPEQDEVLAEDAEPTEAQKKLQSVEKEYEQARKKTKKLRSGTQKLRQKAYGRLDEAFGDVEGILDEWGVAQLEQMDDEKTGSEADDPDEQTVDEDALSNVFTPSQIENVRRSVDDVPTSADNYEFRQAVLEYWHQQLIREYKTLDLTGNDTVKVEYLDEHGSEENEVVRTDTLTVASDASVACLGPDMETRVEAVIYGDEIRIRVTDPDMDHTDERDTVEVVVASIEKKDQSTSEEEDGENEDGEDTEDGGPSVEVMEMGEEEQKSRPTLRPENAPSITLELTETGPHTGQFVGRISSVSEGENSPANKLELSPNRTVRIAYKDEKTKSHDGSWVQVTKAEIVPGSEGEQEVIKKQESQLDLQSELEKGIALGKLARVYQDLGLRAEAGQTFDDALKVVKKVAEASRDTALGEEATYQMWDLYFASGQEEAAVEACNKLIRTFPDSPLADNALLIMAKAEKRKRDAVKHLKRLINNYPDSPLAPEAQYRMAVMKEDMGRFSVSAYETVTNKWPGNNYAAKSLLKLAEYYVDKRDYERAMEYLERITLDFPDFSRLDKTTYMRGVCAYRMGNTQTAYRLMHEVLEKYPGTSVAKSAAKIAKLLGKKLKDR